MLNNSVFSKTLQNVCKEKNLDIVDSERKAEKTNRPLSQTRCMTVNGVKGKLTEFQHQLWQWRKCPMIMKLVMYLALTNRCTKMKKKFQIYSYCSFSTKNNRNVLIKRNFFIFDIWLKLLISAYCIRKNIYIHKIASNYESIIGSY